MMIEIVIALIALGLGAGLGWWYRGRVDRAFLEAIQKELRLIQGILKAVRDGDLGPDRADNRNGVPPEPLLDPRRSVFDKVRA